MAETVASKLAKRIHADGSAHYKGATAPASPVEGDLWYDTSADALKSYNGSAFVKVSAEIATLSSITGSILVGTETTLTLAGTGFLSSNLVVNFVQSSDGIDSNVTVTPSSTTAASVTVPAAVYNNVSNGNAVTIKVTNSDSSESGTQNVTAKQYPTGGTITTDGNTRIHTFTSSGTFTNYTSNLAVTYLVIAGGGGGGGDYGGGGGAGGYRTNKSGQTSGRNSSAEASLALSTGAKTVTVGGGGAGGIYDNTKRGNQGSSSVFDSITSIGGGYGTGEGSSPSPGGNGGSGGGAYYSGSGGSGTSGQGFDGGDGVTGPHYSQGGGGGAGSAGADATTSSNGNGGNGLANNITGSAVTRAGGGGGGYSSDQGIAAGSGGSGGGGNGGASNGANGQAGTANTGSGGGGAGGSGSTTGGAGGSGLVVVSYDVTTI